MKPWHPALVHFPVVLLIVQAGLSWLRRYKPEWLSVNQLMVSQVAATASLLPAMISGTWEEDHLKNLAAPAQSLVEQHELSAYALLFASGMLLVWLYLRHDRWKPREETAFCLTQTLNLALVILTAHWGGNLVYIFGLGTQIR
jgi:uncharacterized membrane protein